MNYPFPPDPDCNELEMVKRYCSMASVRCYNVGVAVQNLFGYHKKAQTEDFLMIFMEDWQREKFRCFSKTIVLLCTPNIHTINQYMFLSILVLDSFGQCVPIMQAVSANDINRTIREMFKTMIELEAEASTAVTLIMADHACFNEVQECFCDIFTNNSNVNLTPSHNVYTDVYNKNIQTSFRMPCDRLDRLIYAIYETNSRYGFREEKIALDFYGNAKSWPIAELERCHPSDVSFEISSQSKTSWSVTQSSWNVGDINTSHFVTFLNEEEPICAQDSCTLRCSKCPVVKYCAHQFNCTCSEFASKQVCTHIHVIIMNDLIDRNEPTQLDHTYGSEAAIPFTLKSVVTEKEGISCLNDSDQINKKLESYLKGSQVTEQGPLLSDKEISLKEEAKSCLWSMIRYIDGFNDSSDNVTAICNKVIKTTKDLLPKNKQMTCRINQIVDTKELVEKCSNSKPLNRTTDLHKDCTSKITTVHKNADIRQPKMASINQNNTATNQDKSRIGSNLISASMEKNISSKENHERQILGAHKPRFKVLKYALDKDVWDFSWWILACSKPEDSLLILSQAFNSDERDKLLEKFLLAKTIWGCGKCQNDMSIDSLLSGYIECYVCCEWFHRTCCNYETLNEGFEDQFSCDKCTKFSNEQLSQTSVFTDVVSYIVTDVQY